ncbi:MAG: hypothetical protein U1F98_17315 [Verrucomicrobiota bacterium]
MLLLIGVILSRRAGSGGLAALLVLPAVPLAGVSVVFGVLGIRECIREPERYEGGQVAGVFALVLSGLVLVTLVPVLVGGLDSVGRAAPARQPSADTQEAIVWNRFHCILHPPGPPWVRVNPRKYGPGPIAAFDRPGMSFSISVMRIAPGTEEPLERVIRMSKSAVREETQDYLLLSEGARELRDISGWQIRTRAKMEGKEFYFEQWLGATNGVGYQLSVWGLPSRELEIQEEADRVFSGFEIAQPPNLKSAPGAAPALPLETPRFQPLPKGF